MAFGRFLARRFRPAIVAAACVLAACALMPAAPAFAQQPPPAQGQDQDQQDQPAPRAPANGRANTQHNDPAGRVAVEGAPRSFDADLARLLREEPSPDSLFEARRQAERAADVVSKLLESEGYYQASVTPIAERNGGAHRRVKVELGPLFTIADRKITLDEGQLHDVAQRDIEALLEPLAIGVPARAQLILDLQDAILRKLRQAGYPDARANTVDALADGAANTMEITYHIVPGPRTSFGEMKLSGLVLTRPDYIRNLAPWSEGESYSEAKLEQFRARLAETGLFATSGATLDAQAQPAPSPYQQTRPVDVEVTERERQTIALGASASTSEGYGVNGEWDLRNWSGRGDTVTVASQIASLQSFVELGYRRPNITRYGRNLKLSLRFDDFQTDAYDQLGATLGAALEEQLTPRVRGSVGVEAGYASIADEQAQLLGRDRRDLYLFDVIGTAEYVGVRDILDPKNGVRARLNIEPGVTFGDTTIAYTRVSGEAAIYARLFTDDLTGAVRGRLGAIIGPNGAPPEKLFFAGGGGSVRGYDYQSLSPRDADNNPVGGRSLVETSLELRYRINDTFGAVAFIDAGAAGEDIAPPIDQMRAGAGFGVRYYTGFGPLRADLAFPLDKRTGDADFQIYFSIGQAF